VILANSLSGTSVPLDEVAKFRLSAFGRSWKSGSTSRMTKYSGELAVDLDFQNQILPLLYDCGSEFDRNNSVMPR
jgi:hypothetical protein